MTTKDWRSRHRSRPFTAALVLEGVVLWANHIQAIHSQRPILRSTKLLEQSKILMDEKSMFAR